MIAAVSMLLLMLPLEESLLLHQLLTGVRQM
jgi:hypothetical protein